MKLSTRTRYGLRLMLDLALKHGHGPVFLKDIANEEAISEKYLSLIIMPLKAAGLVLSTRGAHGGYTLSRQPDDVSLKEIFDALEGEAYLVDCLKNASTCKRSNLCATRDVWHTLSLTIGQVLGAMTLGDLAGKSREKAEQNLMYHI